MLIVPVLLFVGVVLLVGLGCSSRDSLPNDRRTAQADAQVRAVWGKSLAELPTVSLVIISAHNEDIRTEFEWAFSLYSAVKYGQKVEFDWRDVGGGSSSIRQYLGNVYQRADSAGIDILWGGGEFNFVPLGHAGLLEPLRLGPEVLGNIPAQLGGVPMYDEQLRWIGAAVSAFGFIYNDWLLRRVDIEPPSRWEDLGEPRFADLLALADPTQSGSAAAAYRTIACSADNWPDGWARLLRVLSNAKRFTDSAGVGGQCSGAG